MTLQGNRRKKNEVATVAKYWDLRHVGLGAQARMLVLLEGRQFQI